MSHGSQRLLLGDIGRTIRSVRASIGWSQRHLAARSGVAQPTISQIERGLLPSLTLEAMDRLCVALGVRYSVSWDLPRVVLRPTDHVHARCSAYVARRLEANGWLVEREVDIEGGRARGSIDVFAFNPRSRALLVLEIKTEIVDVGAIERQLNWYLGEAGRAATERGWRSSRPSSGLILLMSRANDDILVSLADVFRAGFPGRARDLRSIVAGDVPAIPRAVAMIDPRSRRANWLVATTVDGRRTPASYRDYRDAAELLATRMQRPRS